MKFLIRNSLKNQYKRITLLLGLFSFFFFTNQANAGIFSFFKDESIYVKAQVGDKLENSQIMPILESSPFAFDSESITISGSTLVVEDGSAGTLADIPEYETSTLISRYIVQNGDTISSIAKMFKVSVNTILWANEVTPSTLKVGTELIILPISGIQHIIKKGDTIESIAAKYKVDSSEILDFNNISADTVLTIGDILIVPDAELEPVVQKSKINQSVTAKLHGANGPALVGYYVRPINGGTKSQGLHGYNGVDLAAPIGTTIKAAAAGTVLISSYGSWNYGYGNYVVISHPNGTQTLYAHASKLMVRVGERVVQGQKIAEVGSTGKSTGPHLHFEIRGAKNPF